MATLQNVRDRVDTWLAARWPTVQARQTAYAATHNGRYWQGLVSAANIPNHLTGGFADAIADRLGGKPTDQSETWLDFLPEINGVAIPAAVTMDVYQTSAGWGYVATIFAALNGTAYTRSQNVGPETGRTVAWTQVAAVDALAAQGK